MSRKTINKTRMQMSELVGKIGEYVEKLIDIDEQRSFDDELLEVSKGMMIGDSEAPAPGDLPKEGQKMISSVYKQCRIDGGDVDRCAKLAWGAVDMAGYKTITRSGILRRLEQALGELYTSVKSRVEIAPEEKLAGCGRKKSAALDTDNAGALVPEDLWQDEELEKAKRAKPGERRKRADGTYEKQPDGSWVMVSDADRGPVPVAPVPPSVDIGTEPADEETRNRLAEISGMDVPADMTQIEVEERIREIEGMVSEAEEDQLAGGEEAPGGEDITGGGAQFTTSEGEVFALGDRVTAPTLEGKQAEVTIIDYNPDEGLITVADDSGNQWNIDETSPLREDITGGGAKFTTSEGEVFGLGDRVTAPTLEGQPANVTIVDYNPDDQVITVEDEYGNRWDVTETSPVKGEEASGGEAGEQITTRSGMQFTVGDTIYVKGDPDIDEPDYPVKVIGLSEKDPESLVVFDPKTNNYHEIAGGDLTEESSTAESGTSNELTIENAPSGTRVSIDENYGGGSGTIVEWSPSGKFVVVETDNGERNSYHASNLAITEEEEE